MSENETPDKGPEQAVNEEAEIPPVDSSYLFVELAARRCAQLMRGAKPKVDLPAHKFTTIAIEEVGEGLIPWGPTAEDEEDGGGD